MKVTVASAVDAIDQHGVLLVYPVKNKPDLPSLWTHFYPRTKMIWDWSAEGSDKVAHLWHLRTEIALSGDVVYTKWISGRATFISKELFTALLSYVCQTELSISDTARDVLSVLEDDSPQATKSLREATGLTGKFYESSYQKALRELWNRLLIVGFGEVDEGGFPSLAVGATNLMFEELWDESKSLSAVDRDDTLASFIPEGSPYFPHLSRWRKRLERENASREKE